jgi:hypothetical protein
MVSEAASCAKITRASKSFVIQLNFVVKIFDFEIFLFSEFTVKKKEL